MSSDIATQKRKNKITTFLISTILAAPVLAFLVLANPLKLFAATEPNPNCYVSGGSTQNWTVNTEHDITFSLYNYGAAADHYYLDVSYSSNLQVVDNANDGYATWHNLPSGSTGVNTASGVTMTSIYPIYYLEGWNVSYPSSTLRNSTLTFKATSTGSYWIKYRVSMHTTAADMSAASWKRFPSSSSEVDQQGWSVNKITVNSSEPQSSVNINSITANPVHVGTNATVLVNYDANLTTWGYIQAYVYGGSVDQKTGTTYNYSSNYTNQQLAINIPASTISTLGSHSLTLLLQFKPQSYGPINESSASIPEDSTTFNLETTNSAPTRPLLVSPTNTTGSIDPNNAYLNWNDSTDTDSSDSVTYRVNYKTSSSSAWASVNTSNSNYTLFGLNSNTNYLWYVEACDDHGSYAPQSETWSFTTASNITNSITTAAANPSTLTAYQNTSSSLDINITISNNTPGYLQAMLHENGFSVTNGKYISSTIATNNQNITLSIPAAQTNKTPGTYPCLVLVQFAPNSTGPITQSSSSIPELSTSLSIQVLQTNTYSHTISVNPQTLTKTPGESITIAATINNTGNSTDSYTVSATGNSWNYSLSETSFSLSAGTSKSITISSAVPLGTSSGSYNTTVAVTSPHSQATATLTTTVTTQTTPKTTFSSVEISPSTKTISTGEVATYTATIIGNATTTGYLQAWAYNSNQSISVMNGVAVSETGTFTKTITLTIPNSQTSQIGTNNLTLYAQFRPGSTTGPLLTSGVNDTVNSSKTCILSIGATPNPATLDISTRLIENGTHVGEPVTIEVTLNNTKSLAPYTHFLVNGTFYSTQFGTKMTFTQYLPEGHNSIRLVATDTSNTVEKELFFDILPAATPKALTFSIDSSNNLIQYKGNLYNKHEFTEQVINKEFSSEIVFEEISESGNTSLWQVKTLNYHEVDLWESTGDLLAGVVDRCDANSGDLCYGVNLSISAIPGLEELQEGASAITNSVFVLYEGSAYIITQDNEYVKRVQFSAANVGFAVFGLALPTVIDAQAVNQGVRASVHYAQKAEKAAEMRQILKAAEDDAITLMSKSQYATKYAAKKLNITEAAAEQLVNRIKTYKSGAKILSNPDNVVFFGKISNKYGEAGLQEMDRTIQIYENIKITGRSIDIKKIDSFTPNLNTASTEAYFDTIMDAKRLPDPNGKLAGDAAVARSHMYLESQGYEKVASLDGRTFYKDQRGGFTWSQFGTDGKALNKAGDVDMAMRNPQTNEVLLVQVKAGKSNGALTQLSTIMDNPKIFQDQVPGSTLRGTLWTKGSSIDVHYAPSLGAKYAPSVEEGLSEWALAHNFILLQSDDTFYEESEPTTTTPPTTTPSPEITTSIKNTAGVATNQFKTGDQILLQMKISQALAKDTTIDWEIYGPDGNLIPEMSAGWQASAGKNFTWAPSVQFTIAGTYTFIGRIGPLQTNQEFVVY